VDIQCIAWGLTLTLEAAGAAGVWLAARIAHPPLHHALWTVLGVNTVTHPLFWLALRRLPHPDATAVLIGEVVVTAVEAALYSWLLVLAPARAVALGLALNGLSWLGGILLWQQLFAS
jgi:hypothetical protein